MNTLSLYSLLALTGSAMAAGNASNPSGQVRGVTTMPSAATPAVPAKTPSASPTPAPAASPVTPAGPVAVQIPTITGITMSKMAFAAGEPVTYTVQGVGGPCKFHVRFTPPLALVTQTSNDKNPPPPPSGPPEVSVAKASALPYSGSEAAGVLKPAKYSVVARAEGSDSLGGNDCKGQASVHEVYVATSASSEAATLATETSANKNRRGTINGLVMSKSPVEADEPIKYIVDGIGQECAFQIRFVSDTSPGVEYPFPKLATLPVTLAQNEGVGKGLIKPGKYTVFAAASAADNAGGKGCLGQAQAKLDVKAAPVVGLVGQISVVSKITGLSFSKAQFTTEEPLAYTVQGTGGPCKFHMRFQPQPAGAELAFAKEAPLPFSAAQNEGVGKGLFKPGAYLVTAQAYAADIGSNLACSGSATANITVVPK